MVGRKNLKFGRRDVLELTHEQSVKLRRTMRRYRVAKCAPEKRGKMRKGQLFSDDYTVKLFATVEFWMACRAVARRAKAEAASGADRFGAPASPGWCKAFIAFANMNSQEMGVNWMPSSLAFSAPLSSGRLDYSCWRRDIAKYDYEDT